MTTPANLAVAELRFNLHKLSPSQRKFAGDLCSQFARKHYLSNNQMEWVVKLTEAAKTPKAPLAIDQVLKDAGVNLSGVQSLFQKATQKLKHPKVVLSKDGNTFILSRAGAKNPGAINITSEGAFGTRKWYGRITPEGDFQPSFTAKAVESTLTPLLKELAVNPAAVAKAHGTLTGHCCFCNRPLTDKRSVSAGFGPICAGNFGLYSEWEVSASVAA